MPEPHDFTAGVTIGGLTFRVVDFAPNTWQTSEDKRLRHHGAGIEDDLTPQTIRRIIDARPIGEQWEVLAAESLRAQLREIVESLEAEQRQADTFMHDLEGPGIVVDSDKGQVRFTLHQGLPAGTWRVGTGAERHDDNPDEVLSADNVRSAMEVRPDVEADGVLHIYAADSLRDRFAGIVRNIEAKERLRQENERDAERMEEVTQQLDGDGRLTFSGTVTLSEDDGTPAIDGRPVLPEVAKTFGGRPLVEVYLGAEREPALTAAGEAVADEGWAGTDETPGEVPLIEVGKLDLLGKLRDLEGRHVELVVRKVERPDPFFVEVDPRLEDETWKIEDVRFGAKPRRDKELTGEKLVELVEAGCRSIVVSFLSADAVYRAIETYHAIEREKGRVLPKIEVVPGKGETGPRTFELKARQVGASQFVAGVARTGFGLAGMDTPEELAAAQRALDGHRDGKLIVILDPEDIAKVLTEEGHFIIDAAVDDGEWDRIATAINEALEARKAKAEGTEPPADFAKPEPRDLEGEADVVILHEGHELTVYVDRRLDEGEWTVAEGMDPAHRFTGGFTTDRVRTLIAEHHETFTVGLDLLPNAIAVLVGLGEVNGDRDVSEWCEEIRAKLAGGSSHPTDEPAVDIKPQQSVSALVVSVIREAIKEVEANLRAANREAFPRRGGLGALAQFAPSPTSASLNNAYERLIEALMWAEKHEQGVEAARKALEGKTAAQIMAEHMQAAGLDLSKLGIGKEPGA